MKKGFSVVELLLIVVVIGLVGVVGWLVYDRQQSKKSDDSATQTQTSVQTQQTDNEEDESRAKPEELEYKIIDGIKYTTPSGWKNTQGVYDTKETSKGRFILSPDYVEAGGPQFALRKGAFINFETSGWDALDSNTSVSEAANSVKNDEGGYFDRNSVKVTSINGKQVVTYNSGHTTDGVTVLYKTSDGKWLDIGFSTVTGEDGEYNAQDSSHYKTFLKWVEDFITLNQ